MTRSHPLLACALLAASLGCAPTREQFLRDQVPAGVRLIARQAATASVPAASEAVAVGAPSAMGMPETAGASDETASTAFGPLTIAARWIGPARPLITGYDLIGRVSRFVVPYTRQTWLVELRVHNRGAMPQRVRSTDWELVADPGRVQRHPLELTYFKDHWPTVAVRNEAMMLDQAMAIGHVIRTIWGDRTIEPDETVVGILPFLAGSEPPTATRLTWMTAPVTLEFGAPSLGANP
jgi:hypothetical protein